MPIDTTPSSTATSALQGIPFSSLIGAPLNAAIDAQVASAKSTVDFIQNVGLTGPPENRRPIQVEFIYYVDGKETKLMVPLLTIVPIPYLAVDEVEINFKANISASASTYQENNSSEETKASGSLDVGVDYGPFSAKAHFEASYSSKKDSKATQDSKYSVEYTMDVRVHAKQESMPAGLAKVLNILEGSITPTEAKETFRLSVEKLVVSDVGTSKNFLVKATFYDNQGKRAKDKTLSLTDASTSSFPTEGLLIDPPLNSAKSNSEGELEFEVKYDAAKYPKSAAQERFLDFTSGGAKKRITLYIPEHP